MELLISCHDIVSRLLKKSYSLSQKYQDPTLIIIIIGKSFGVNNRSFFLPTIGLQLWIIVLSQLCQFQNIIQSKLVYKSLYISSIRAMKIKLPKQQDNDKKIRKLRVKELSKDQKKIEKVLHYQSFLYVSKIICFKLISRYYNNLLASHLGI